MEKADGRVVKGLSVINMMGITVMIRNMAMEYSHGLVGIFTKESIRMMKEMALEK